MSYLQTQGTTRADQQKQKVEKGTSAGELKPRSPGHALGLGFDLRFCGYSFPDQLESVGLEAARAVRGAVGYTCTSDGLSRIMS